MSEDVVDEVIEEEIESENEEDYDDDEEDNENLKVLQNVFKIDFDVELEDEEIEYIEVIAEDLRKFILDKGTSRDYQFKEIIRNDLYKRRYYNLIKFLNIQIEGHIETLMESKVRDEKFIKFEEIDSDNDFFKDYLKDSGINDLIHSLYGRERKAEGRKEIFVKVQAALIPTEVIKEIERDLKSLFNETSFKSQKRDEEQGKLIMLTFRSIRERIDSLPHHICDTDRTRGILTMVALKLSNLIGISENYRNQLMDTVKESYKSNRAERDNNQNQEAD